MGDPVSDRPDPAEVARRVRAAQGWAKKSREEMADAIGLSGSVYDEMAGKRAKLRGASWDELRAIAELCEVPLAWFWADHGRLHEILTDDAPDYVRHDRSTRTGPATARALKDRLRREGRPDKDQEEPGEQTG